MTLDVARALLRISLCDTFVISIFSHRLQRNEKYTWPTTECCWLSTTSLLCSYHHRHRHHQHSHYHTLIMLDVLIEKINWKLCSLFLSMFVMRSPSHTFSNDKLTVQFRFVESLNGNLSTLCRISSFSIALLKAKKKKWIATQWNKIKTTAERQVKHFKLEPNRHLRTCKSIANNNWMEYHCSKEKKPTTSRRLSADVT